VIVFCLLAGAALTATSLPASDPVSRPILDQQAPQRVWDISLTSPRARPRLGMPDFVAPSADAELREMGTAAAEVLWADLQFEQEFYMIPRSESAGIPAAPTAATLPAERWSQIGADFVVLGVLARSGDTVKVRLQLVPIRAASGQGQAFSYEYENCTTRNPRSCAHAIADHMHKELRGLDGVAQTQLAFVSDRDAQRMRTRPIPDSGTSKEVYIGDYDGANQRAVTANRSLTLGPSWSPDARSLAYSLWPAAGQPTNIYLNTMDGRSAQPIVTGGDSNWLPSWAPDGSQLAFASNRSGNMDIWVVNRDGSNLRQVTRHQAIDNAPTWSPTGQQIAFVSDRSGGNQIYVMNADGTGLQKLTSDPGDHDRPTWSPLGFIAYTAGSPLGHNISLYDMSTGSIIVLTDGRGDNGSPAVSPNGRHIAFTTSRWGRDQIAIIDRTGRNLRQVTTVGTNSSPNWSRTRGR
jgi:TolB protein